MNSLILRWKTSTLLHHEKHGLILSRANVLLLLRSFLYDPAQAFLLIDARPTKLTNFEAAECPPPIARSPRTEARFISNALLFSEELKTEFVLCDGQLSFSHWILQVEPSPCLVATFSMTWTLPGQNRQDTDSSSFSSSFSLDTIARPLIVFHVPSADGVDELNWLSSSGSSSWILERLALSATAAFSLF